MNSSSKFAAAFFIFVASISYGSLGVVAKFAYAEGVLPTTLALSQMFFGTIFFSILKLGKLTSFFAIKIKNILLLSIGGAMSALTAYFYYEALHLLDASVAIIMLFQFVWIALALELWHQKRAPTKIEIFSVLLCYIGTYLGVGFRGSSEFYGLFLGFLSGASFAVYIYFSSSKSLEEEPDARAFWIIFSAFLSLVLLSVSGAEPANMLVTVKWGAVCGALGVLVPFYIYAVFSPRIGAAATSLIGSAELPAALVLSTLFLNETLTPTQIVGASIVVLAVFTVFWVEAKAK